MYTIVADERDFILVNKYAGMHFHSQDGHPGLVATVRSETGLKLYPVHRLDSITSGILLLAKSSSVARDLSHLFAQHKIQKYYVALAQGKPKKKQGWVIGDMAKSRRSKYKLLHSKQNPAITQFFSASVQPGLRCYLFKPLSGKTHQLRVAMVSLGVPILGDQLYGGAVADRAYLHAWQLEFFYNNQHFSYSAEPESGEFYDLPQVNDILQQWQQPARLSWPSYKK